MSVRLNAERASGKQMNVQFIVTDTNENSGYQVRNRIAAFVTGSVPDSNATLRGTKAEILRTVATGKVSDGVTVEGDKNVAEDFLGLFDVIKPNDVNLVLPPDAEEHLPPAGRQR
jgi:alkyl sulfatase BDS1-like metallo-beta-lactamase superfamily hydrolase